MFNFFHFIVPPMLEKNFSDRLEQQLIKGKREYTGGIFSRILHTNVRTLDIVPLYEATSSQKC